MQRQTLHTQKTQLAEQLNLDGDAMRRFDTTKHCSVQVQMLKLPSKLTGSELCMWQSAYPWKDPPLSGRQAYSQ